jgi:Tol biopolymer transport system component
MIATKEWPKVVRGEVTASVLESGVPVDLTKRPQTDLLLIDVTSGNGQVVTSGDTRSWQLSPNGRTVVLTRRIAAYLPKADEKLPLDYFSGLSTLEVVGLDGKPTHIRSELSRDVLVDSVRWSPDSKELAFFGYASGRDQPPKLYRLNVETQSLVALSLDNLDAAPLARESAGIEWTDKRQVLVYAAARDSDKRASATTRRDWWLVDQNRAPRCVTANMQGAPKQLWSSDGRQAVCAEPVLTIYQE